MPTYSYKCLDCKEKFDEEMDKDSKRTPPCPNCDSKNTKKIITSHPVIFNGDGFTKSAKK